MNKPQMWLDQTPDHKKFAVAIVAGLLLELAAFALILPMFMKPPPPAQVSAPVKITIVAPPAPKPPPPAPKPPPPKPVTPPQPVTPPKPVPPPPPRPVAHHIVRHVVPPRPLPPPPKVVQPPPPQTPPAPPQPQAPPQGQVDLFRLKMNAAVQAVANDVYPASAQGAHETGSPVVSFTDDDGEIADVAVVQSCGYPLLDAAAMQAVRIAHYPPIPPGMPDRFTIAVNFQMAAPSVDGD